MTLFPKVKYNKKKIIILISLIILSGFHFTASAQCNNKISLNRVESTAIGLNQGSIEVNITSNGNFVAELYTVTGTGKNLHQKLTGSGDRNLIFKQLSPSDNYQVLVIFNDEEQIFCKKRQISEISTLKK